MLSLVIILTLFSTIAGRKRLPAFLIFSSIALVAFIPSCTAIMGVIDSQRFGEFNYATYKDVHDFRVERYLPPEATNIRLLKIPNGFRAKFMIAESDVKNWHNHFWAEYGDLDEFKQNATPDESPSVNDEMMLRFEGLNWNLPVADVAYAAPSAPNGATFVIWYNRQSNSAMLWGCYW